MSALKEQKKHIDAFYYYFGITEKGHNISTAIRATAEHVGVTPRTIWNWYDKFNWEQKSQDKQKAIVEEMEKQSNKTLAENRLNYLRVFHKLLDRFINDDFPAEISSVKELDLVVKTCLVLQDAPSEVTKTSNINHNIDADALFDEELMKTIAMEEENADE